MNNAPPLDSKGVAIALPRRVFITGAGGFIGAAIGDRYRSLGVEVRGMDLIADPSRCIISGDVTNPAEWAYHATGCDLFLHCAAIVSMTASWEDYTSVTVHGTRGAIDVARGAGARRFLHLSSIAAGGWRVPNDTDERWPVLIGEEYRYGVAKAASEHTVLAAHASGELPCVIVRPGDVYGPGARVWVELILQMCRSGNLVLPDNGAGMFGPVYIDDLVDGILLAASLDDALGNIFTLAGHEWITVAEFFSFHWRWAGRGGAFPSVPLASALMAPVDATATESGPDLVRLLARQGSFSIGKARTILGYNPKVSLAEGMRRSEEWLRAINQLPPAIEVEQS